MIKEREVVAVIVALFAGVALLIAPQRELGVPEGGTPDATPPPDAGGSDTSICTPTGQCAPDGGPGCAGYGGGGGTGGNGGGAAVALFVSGTSSVKISNGGLVVGNGGPGGPGGAGGGGGAGSLGTFGSDITCNCGVSELDAGAPGMGGPGGSGGAGGGGAGGPTCLYATVGMSASVLIVDDASTNETFKGDAGAGGAPNGTPGVQQVFCSE